MKLKVIMTTTEKLNNINIIPGQLIFVQDQNPAIYLDNSANNRIQMSNVGEEIDIPTYMPGDGIQFEYDEQNNTITINNLGVTVEIKNNTWWINGEDTGVTAIGQDGQDGQTPTISIDSTTSEWVINGIVQEGIYAQADSITQSEYESLVNLLDQINLGITTALKGVGI